MAVQGKRHIRGESMSLLNEKSPPSETSDSDWDDHHEASERLFPQPSFVLKIIRPCLRLTLRPSLLQSTVLRSLWAILPSFLQSSLSKDSHKPERLRPTAYLDGMRGLAAFAVCLCHMAYTCFVITIGYGYGPPDQNRNFLQLPFIRLFYSGPPMVCVFFVISGYSLSFKPLKQMRSHQYDSLLTTMSSSVFRRALRLFVPTITSTFLVLCMLRLGWFERTRPLAIDKTFHRNVQEYHLEPQLTLKLQFYDWIWQMFNFICVFNWATFSGSTNYDLHLWTIPVEFRASLMLFLALVALARLRPGLRLTFLSGLFLFVMRNDRWELMLFFSGMFLAELDLISAITTPPTVAPLHSSLHSLKSTRTILYLSLAILSLYFMSQPDDHFELAPGWRYLATLIPEWWSEKYRFYQTLGSIGLMLATTRLPLLQAPFNTPIIQYLGKISYALYLVHGPVMHVVGYIVEGWAWSITGVETESQYVAGFVLAACINIPLIIWAADVFWRFVDAPSVRFARWVEGKVVVDVSKENGRILPQ
ncbi:acyltransferase [Microthyrium microscopicum]|uniref:Acyltransferase n=1 Tax=Microthyrium microscopicum TaxID=703497 RepID=A0A6A6TWI2_9PEZI|nr:acyltransferase [Microthyrium microscopicum]